MKSRNSVYKSIVFIEENIENKLNADIVASNAGYSKFHYSRLFKKVTGNTISEHIKERRLLCAAKEIINGSRIIDVAIHYGYETHSGFDKAFKKKFGYPPKLLYVMKLAETIYNEIGELVMNYKELYRELVSMFDDDLTVSDKELLEKAYQFSVNAHTNQKRYSGEMYIVHPLNVAIILKSLKQPIETIVLGLLHDTIEKGSNVSIKELEDAFGVELACKVKKLQGCRITEELLKEDEDIILVKLADRLHNMKTIEHLDPSRWKEKATETLEIFSPIAEINGLKELKMELDHLSVKYV